MCSLEAKIRKQQNILIISGYWVILFGVWSIIRVTLMRYIDRRQYNRLFEPVGGFDLLSQPSFELFIFILLLFLLLLDLGIRGYIGLSSIKEGNGKMKKTPIYIIVALCYSLIMILGDIYFINEYIHEAVAFSAFMDALIDITTNIAMVKIFMAAINLRFLSKKQLKQI